MKKILLLILCLIFTGIMASGCVNISIIPDGKWISTSSDIILNIGVPIGSNVSGIADQYENTGELVDSDGAIQKIRFKYLHGAFTVYKYCDNGDYTQEEPLFYGRYTLKNGILTLQTSEGNIFSLSKE